MPAAETVSIADAAGSTEAGGVARAWAAHAGAVPDGIRALVDAGRYLDAAIELARDMIGEPPLAGWKLRFTSAGGPYEVELLGESGLSLPAGAGISKDALSDAFLKAVESWRNGAGTGD